MIRGLGSLLFEQGESSAYKSGETLTHIHCLFLRLANQSTSAVFSNAAKHYFLRRGL